MSQRKDVPPYTQSDGSVENGFIDKILWMELKKLKGCFSSTGFNDEKGCYEFESKYDDAEVKVYKERPGVNGYVVEAYPGAGCWVNSRTYPKLECVGVALVAAANDLEKTKEGVQGLDKWIDWEPCDKQAYRKWLENPWHKTTCGRVPK